MKTVQTALEHRLLLPENSTSSRGPALIMLHGMGADEEDLIGLVPAFDRSILVLSVRAPHRYPYGGYTWYDIGEMGRPEPELFGKSYTMLVKFIDDVLAAYPIDPANVYLLGFSMGTVMSYALSLTRPATFRGVIAHSGYVPEGTDLVLQWEHLSGLSFFVAHGTLDPTIPVLLARRAKLLLENSPASMTYKEYPMGHEISQESLGDAAGFLRTLLDRRLE